MDAIHSALDSCDLFISVAAVADYRPAQAAATKIKKEQQTGAPAIQLTENTDIVATVAQLPNAPITIGFAAETDAALENARRKCARKGLDAIVVNDVSDTSIGFNSDNNEATLIWADGELRLTKQPKVDLAAALVTEIARLFVDQLADAHPQSA